ncbi:MAG: trigger factor family protein, partial [bacterium]|nr:trigger factor family protein [bacterium]
MEILEFTELNPVTLKMRIKVATGAIAREYDMVLADFIRNSNIQGFRPGKAPRKLVEIKVGSSEILRIARDKASHDAFKQALE